MKTTILLKKFFIDEKEFITSDELREYCNSFNLDYGNVLKYFLSRGYLLRIFKGIFYIRNLDELRFGRTKYNRLKLVSKGLELKGVKNWYFGLHTALKFNNMTHVYFNIDDVLSENLFRAKPIEINHRKYKFTKLKPDLLGFGIIEKNGFRYSDPEKTILDFAYLWVYNSIPEKIISNSIEEFMGHHSVSKDKLKDYVEHYPNKVRELVGKCI